MKTKLAQKPQSSIVKFQPPLPEVIKQSKEVQKLKKEKASLVREFSSLMKVSDRRQDWVSHAASTASAAREWIKRTKAAFEPWRAEAHQAHKLVTTTMDEFISSIDSMVRATEGAKNIVLLKAQADMRLAQANIDANQAKENAERGDGEEIPAPLLAPEIEGKTGRKIWCVDRKSWDHFGLQLLVQAAAKDDSLLGLLEPNFSAMDSRCSEQRDMTVIPGFVAGYKIAGTDVFVKVNP